MPIWSTTDINDMIATAEVEIASAVDCLFARTQLQIVANQLLYDLPVNLKSIFNIAYKGRSLEPLTRKTLQKVDYNYIGNYGTPYYYTADQEGTGKLRFYPIPNENVATGGADNVSCVISYFYVPDPANTILIIPKWVSRRLIKAYVCWRLFQREGDGQNLRMAEYYSKKYENGIKLFKLINSSLYATYKKPSRDYNVGYRPPRPQMPSNFGLR